MQLRELYERHSQKALCEAALVCGNSRANAGQYGLLAKTSPVDETSRVTETTSCMRKLLFCMPR